VSSTLFYLANYARTENGIPVNDGSLAAKRKIDYIAKALAGCGYDISLISATRSKKRFKGISGKKSIRINDHVMLTEAAGMGDSDKLHMIKLRNAFSKLWIFGYLVKNISKNDKVVVYHDCTYESQIFLAQRIKKFKIIPEVEDIYQKVWDMSAEDIKRENRMLSGFGKVCIAASDTIRDELDSKNSAVAYGSYECYHGVIPPKGMGERITVICTGSIDRIRETGFMSLDVARELSDKYRMLLSGPITDDAKDEFLRKLEEVNRQAGYEKCRYLGILDDDEYEKLLLDADIALNPQKKGKYDKYIFPSKILTYLGYNLDVVTTPGESIVNSSISDILSISKDHSAKSIAEAVERIGLNRKSDHRDRLKELDEEFVRDLKNVIMSV
jgi:hypothetical protein